MDFVHTEITEITERIRDDGISETSISLELKMAPSAFTSGWGLLINIVN